MQKNGIKLIRVREPNSPKYESSSIKVYRTRNNQDDNYEDLNNITKIVLNIIETSTKYDINIDRDISKINELCQLVEVDDSLERNFPIFAKQWDSVKNGTLTPSKVSKCSDRECYFICQTCGISFKRRIASLIRATSCECSECARKRAHKNRRQSPKEKSIGYLYPSIANELLNDENVTLDIYAIYPGSEKKYLWKCKKCGNIYEMSPKNRTNGHSCPKCAKENRKIKRGKKVVCIETGEIFNSISEASRTKKADASEICKCCKKETFTAKGYHWKYFEES